MTLRKMYKNQKAFSLLIGVVVGISACGFEAWALEKEEVSSVYESVQREYAPVEGEQIGDDSQEQEKDSKQEGEAGPIEDSASCDDEFIEGLDSGADSGTTEPPQNDELRDSGTEERPPPEIGDSENSAYDSIDSRGEPLDSFQDSLRDAPPGIDEDVRAIRLIMEFVLYVLFPLCCAVLVVVMGIRFFIRTFIDSV